MNQKKLFKLKKLFKDDELVKSSSIKFKEDKANRTIGSISKNGLSLGDGGHAEGGKIKEKNSSSFSQFIVIQAKVAKAGYDYNSKQKTSATDNGSKAASHLDYINQQNRNMEEQVFDQTFNVENEIISLNLNSSIICERDFTKVEGKEYSYSFKDSDDFSTKLEITDEAQATYLKALKNGKIEADLTLKIEGGLSENRKELEELNKNGYKLFLENDRKGNTTLHVQGKKEALTNDLERINKLFKQEKTKENIKDIKSNVLNKNGQKMIYQEFNQKKANLKKGVEANLKLEISPKENYSKEILKELGVETIREFNRLTGKNLDVSFAIHTNTKHHHIHLDVSGKKSEVVLSKEQLQAFKTIAAETLYKLDSNDEAKVFMVQEQKRLEESKQVQELQNVYDNKKNVNEGNKFENIISIGRAINQEIKISNDEAKVVELFNRLNGIKSSLETSLKHAETPSAKENFEKKLEDVSTKLNRLEKNITPELLEKVEVFKNKFEEVKTSNLYKDIKDIYKIAQLEAVKEFSDNLKKIGKSSLGDKVLKSAQGEHFNQKFDDFTAERIIKNLHANEFIEKAGTKVKEEDKKEFKELSAFKPRDGKVNFEEVKNKLNEIKSERSSLMMKKDENEVELKIVQSKFIDTTLVKENGFNKTKLEEWGEFRINNAPKHEKEETKEIVSKYKEAVANRVDNLEAAGILKEDGRFVDGKAKEILFENAGKNIQEIVNVNKEAYKEIIEIKSDINSLDRENKESRLEEVKAKEAMKIVRDNKEQLSSQAKGSLMKM